MKKVNIWYIIGIMNGIVSIIMGIWFMSVSVLSVGTAQELVFGADFYTEIHEISVRIFTALSRMIDFIENLKYIIGYFFIFIGITEICVFSSKLKRTSNESIQIENNNSNSNYNSISSGYQEDLSRYVNLLQNKKITQEQYETLKKGLNIKYKR